MAATKDRGISRQALERVSFTPPTSYGLDIEVISFADLRKRILENRFRQAHQINFYLLMLITQGHCMPVVDYLPIACTAGSLVLMSPNQALQFDLNDGCDGWIVIFRAEYLASTNEDAGGSVFLTDAIQGMPACLSLTESSLKTICSCLAQMAMDAQTLNAKAMTNAMLRFTLKALLLRLLMLGEQAMDAEPDAAHFSRFRRFRKLVEEKFSHQHAVADYAAELGCTVKSLTRASQAAVAMGAKEYIAARISLEAKRLLSHTQMQIYTIADQLGFDEPTNFVKFFKRNSGMAPNAFRKQNYSIYN